MVGLPATGLWVIAHECGHQAFSTSKTINNTVGWVLHSAYVYSFFFFRRCMPRRARPVTSVILFGGVLSAPQSFFFHQSRRSVSFLAHIREFLIF